jgi:hypothetical protein
VAERIVDFLEMIDVRKDDGEVESRVAATHRNSSGSSYPETAVEQFRQGIQQGAFFRSSMYCVVVAACVDSRKTSDTPTKVPFPSQMGKPDGHRQAMTVPVVQKNIRPAGLQVRHGL